MNLTSPNLIGPRSLETMRKQLLNLPSQQLLQYLYKPSPNDPPQWLIVSALKEQEDARRSAMGPPQSPPSTVAQQVAQAVASSPLPPPPRGTSSAGSLASMPPAPSPSPMPSPDQMQQQQQPPPAPPPPGMAKGGQVCDCGVASLPYEDNYVGGGIVSFAEGKEVKKDEKKNGQLESARKYRESLEKPSDLYQLAMAEQTGPWANPLKFALGEALSAPARTILGAPASYITGLGWTKDEEGNLIRKSETKENQLQRHPWSDEARAARTEAAVGRDTGELARLAGIVDATQKAKQTPTSTEIPDYLKAPAAPPQYLRAPEEEETVPAGNIVEGKVPEAGGLDAVAGMIASLNQGARAPMGEMPTRPTLGMQRDVAAGEKLGPNDIPMREIPTEEKTKADIARGLAAFGVDREGYMKRKEEALAEQAKDLEGTKTRAWALPVLQASLELMGQSGSLGRGIGKVAPTLGAGLARGYDQVEEQKGLLRKSKDAIEEAKYAMAVGDYNTHRAKVAEAEQSRDESRKSNLTTNNQMVMEEYRQRVDAARDAANNARADSRLGMQLGVNLLTTEREIQSRMEMLKLSTSSDILAAALKADNDKELYDLAKEIVLNPSIETDNDLKELKKRAPEKSAAELQMTLIQSLVDKFKAAKSGTDALQKIQVLKSQLPGFGGGSASSSSNAGFSITPIPKKFDLGLGSLTGQ